MDELIVVAVVVLLAFGVAYGTFGRFRGTRGAISERAHRPRAGSGREGRSRPRRRLATESEFDPRGKQ